ncbi:MAG: polysaccharide biosynthesis protein [Erysipelotrichales bacterium]|nr:polysaccharide biosynthesis protein [Erysipelotrichales bacterium]
MRKERSNFIKEAKVLGAGIFISRLLGLLFVFPFAKMIGPAGVSLYTYAYVPYTLFLDLSSLGIPMGLSKLVARYNAEDNQDMSRLIFKVSLLIMGAVGFISFILINLLAPFYARMVLAGNDSLLNHFNDVVMVIRIVSLPLLIVPIISVIRGFFQGNFYFYPTAVSQVIEQIVRVTFILGATYIVLYQWQRAYTEAVNYSVLAAFLGGLFALAYLLIELKRRNLWNFKTKEKKSRSVIKQIVKYSIPFALFGISFSVFQMIDSLFFNSAMLKNGVTNPEFYYGIYSFNVQKLVFIPISLFLCLGTTIMPDITQDVAIKDFDQIQMKTEKSFQWIFWLLIPLTFFTFFHSQSIYNVFYTPEQLGGAVLRIYAFLIIIIVINGLLVNILQGLNVLKATIVAIIAGLIVKFLLCYILIRYFGFAGAILSSLLGFGVTILVNLHNLRKSSALKSQTIAYAFKCLLISTLAILVVLGLNHFLPINVESYLTNFIGLGIYFAIFAIIYFSVSFKAHLWPKKIK